MLSRDHRGEHHLRGAVVGGRQVRRVDRQQEDRDQLREHARGRVGGARRREAAQVVEHLAGDRRRGARADRAVAGRRRAPSSAQVAGSVVKPGVAEAVDEHRDEAGRDRACAPARRPAPAPSSVTSAVDEQRRRRRASPITPCSAATVIGSECETVVRAGSISLVEGAAERRPSPSAPTSRRGRSARLERRPRPGRRGRCRCCGRPRCRWSACRRRSPARPAPTSAERRDARRRPRQPQRRIATMPRPASRAAKLVIE